MKMTKAASTILLIFLLATPAMARVTVPALINDNMVLQQQTAVPLWGWAEPGEKIKVKASWQDSPSTA
ncbi:MAG: hypothetical protein ACYSPI_06935, partial [Planctomycetota bacterium]